MNKRDCLRPFRLWCSTTICALGFIIVLARNSASAGPITLPTCLGENVILQSAGHIFLWGWSDYPHGEIEFQGRVTPWKGVPVNSGNQQRWRWDIRLAGATNLGPDQLTIRAGLRPWLKKLDPHRTVAVTNVCVGEVWLWAAKPTLHSLKATLTEEQHRVLQARARMIRSRLAALTEAAPDGGWPWETCQTNNLSAAACYFALHRLRSNGNGFIGFIEVPVEDLMAAMPHIPDGAPARNDWRNLDEPSLERAFFFAAQSASNVFNSAVTQQTRTINQLKLQGVATNSILLRWDDVDDFSRVRLVTPPAIKPLTVRGIIW